MGAANNVNKSQAYALRGTNQQTDVGLLWIPPSLKVWGPPSSTGVTSFVDFREGIYARSWELLSRNASNACGIGGRLANKYWIAGKRIAAGTYTDATSGVQAATADILVLSTTTNNDGFMIGSLVPFNWVSVNVTTAETGSAPVHNIYYSTGAGATWTAFAATQAITADTGAVLTNSANWAAGEIFTCFAVPSDWVVSKGLATGFPDGYYAINVRATTASGTTGAKSGGIEIGLMEAVSVIGAGGIWEVETGDYWMPRCDGLVAMFLVSTVPNRICAEVGGR